MKTTPFILVVIVLALVCVAIGYTAYPLMNDNKAAETPKNSMKDYQLDVYEDSTVVFDGDRHVATLRFDSTQALDSLIMDDNQ